MKNRIEIESAITSMEDVALCIKLVDDMIAEGTENQQVQSVEILSEIFKARYSALNPTDPTASSTAQQTYIGNVNSKKFHLPSCPNLPAEKNQVLFSSYEEAVEAGYTPCSSCIK